MLRWLIPAVIFAVTSLVSLGVSYGSIHTATSSLDKRVVTLETKSDEVEKLTAQAL